MNEKCLFFSLVFSLTLNASACYQACNSADTPNLEQAFSKGQKGDLEGAIALLKSCGDKSTWTISAKIKAAKIYEQAGQLGVANQLLDQVTIYGDKIDSGSLALAWRYKADCARDAGKLDEAATCFERSGKVSTADDMRLLGYRGAARIRRQQNRFEDSLNLLVKAAPNGSNDLWWHYERASTLIELKKFSLAVQDLGFVINAVKARQQKVGDRNTHILTQSYNLRVKCYEQLHMVKEATEDRKALKGIDQSWAEDLLGPDNIH